MPETPDGFPIEVPTHRLAHLSDTHLTSRDVLYNERIDADAALDRAATVLRRAAADDRGLDALVVSGDLTDTGDPDAYARVAAALEGIAPQIIWVTGNHDVRTTFHTVLLGVEAPGPLVRVHDVGGLRVIALDSTVPGAGHGGLTAAHLAELAEVLSEPTLNGTVIALHHAPVPPPSPLLAYFALDRSSRSALAGIVAGTDVRLILAGHHHLAQSSSLAGIQVAVAGSTAIRTDPLAPVGHERTYAAGSFQLVDLYPAGGAVVSVIPVDGADEVFDLDESGCAGVIAAHPIARTPAPKSRPQSKPSRQRSPRRMTAEAARAKADALDQARKRVDEQRTAPDVAAQAGDERPISVTMTAQFWHLIDGAMDNRASTELQANPTAIGDPDDPNSYLPGSAARQTAVAIREAGWRQLRNRAAEGDDQVTVALTRAQWAFVRADLEPSIPGYREIGMPEVADLTERVLVVLGAALGTT